MFYSAGFYISFLFPAWKKATKRHDLATCSPLIALIHYQIYSAICKTQKSMAKKLKIYKDTKHLFAFSLAHLNQ